MFEIKYFNYKDNEFVIEITDFDNITNSPIEILNHKTNNKKLFFYIEENKVEKYKLFFNSEYKLNLKIISYES